MDVANLALVVRSPRHVNLNLRTVSLCGNMRGKISAVYIHLHNKTLLSRKFDQSGIIVLTQ